MAQDDSLAEGVLELHPKGFGFLRQASRNYIAQPTDAYVPGPMFQKLGLREGLLLSGPVEPARRGSGPRLTRIETVEGRPAEEYRARKFDELTPIDPHEQLRLETGPEPLTTRVIDMLAPIGKGQRG